MLPTGQTSPANGSALPAGQEDHAEIGAPNVVPVVVQIFAIARKRKWAIFVSVMSALALGLLITLLMTPLYTASTVLEIQRETQNFTNVAGADNSENQGTAIDPEFYQTQQGLIQSKSLAKEIATDLKLYDSARFFNLFKSDKAGKWFEDGRLIAGASTRDERLLEAGDILLEHLGVKNERLSRLFTISFTSPDANFSKQIIDAWGKHFIQATLERRYEMTSYARRFLEDRLARLRERIDASERQLVSYASIEGIINLPTGTVGGRNNSMVTETPLATVDLATLNAELAQATADRIQAESRLTKSNSSSNEALNNQGISTIRATRADVAAQYAKVLEQFAPDYPPARALKSQLDELDRSIAKEEGRVKNALQQNYRSAATREQELQSKVNALKSGVLDLRRRSIQYNILKREVETNQQLYDGLLQRYKEIGIAGGVGVNNISILDYPEVPKKPSSPKLLLNLVVSLLLGLVLGAGIALLLEQISDGVDDPAEVQRALGVPLLGTIPTVDEAPSEVLEDPKAALSEAYFSLRTNLAFSTDHGFPKTLAITSARPAEGKSLTAYALARSLARPDRRVLLIDGDMRSPSLHHIVGVSGSAGLSNYLSGNDEVTALIKPTRQDGLFVLPAGPLPPNAADLLSGRRIEKLLADLGIRFDHIIVDGPPVMGLADAPLIASQVEGVAFVVEAHETSKSMARTAISRLFAANAHIFGVVITKFDTKRAHYGYGYDYGYGYGYGAGTKEPVDAV